MPTINEPRAPSARPSPSNIADNITTETPKIPSVFKLLLDKVTTHSALFSFEKNQASNKFGYKPSVVMARALAFKKHVVLCTGSNSTVGSVVLGEALKAVGVKVSYVPDEHNANLLKDSIMHIHPELQAAELGIIHSSFPSIRHLETDTATTEDYSKKIINDADAVIVIEPPDISANDNTSASDSSLRQNISHLFFDVVRAANDRNLLTVIAGEEGVDTPPATLVVKTGEINSGACAIALTMLKLYGKLNDAIKPDTYEELMAMQMNMNRVREDTVGMRSDEHKQLLANLRNSVDSDQAMPKDVRMPTEVGVFDSSNGAFVAATVLKTELDKLGYKTNFIITVDHGNAPYGQYTGTSKYQVGQDGKEEVLYRLVSNGLKTAEEKGAALAIMACNTACTVPEAQKTVNIPVVDLIQVTAKAMAEHGGGNPVMICTPATALSDAYPDAVREASGGVINLKKTLTPDSGPNGEDGYAEMIGAPLWAPAINNLEHIDPAKKNKTWEMIKEIVDKVPENATSVWLTCTHYPALQEHIEEAMKARGLGNIPVVNPMVYQAHATIEKFDEMEKKKDSKLGRNRLNGTDKVITSGGENTKDLSLISESTVQLYNSVPVETANFGQTRVQTLERIGRHQYKQQRSELFREISPNAVEQGTR